MEENVCTCMCMSVCKCMYKCVHARGLACVCWLSGRRLEGLWGESQPPTFLTSISLIQDICLREKARRVIKQLFSTPSRAIMKQMSSSCSPSPAPVSHLLPVLGGTCRTGPLAIFWLANSWVVWHLGSSVPLEMELAGPGLSKWTRMWVYTIWVVGSAQQAPGLKANMSGALALSGSRATPLVPDTRITLWFPWEQLRKDQDWWLGRVPSRHLASSHGNQIKTWGWKNMVNAYLIHSSIQQVFTDPS